MDLRMYILVNSDIKMDRVKLANQVGHAVNVIVYNLTKEAPEFMEEYMKGEIKKILLSMSEKELEKLNPECTFIYDEDILTCVGVGILDYNNLPHWIKELKLLR